MGDVKTAWRQTRKV